MPGPYIGAAPKHEVITCYAFGKTHSFMTMLVPLHSPCRAMVMLWLLQAIAASGIFAFQEKGFAFIARMRYDIGIAKRKEVGRYDLLGAESGHHRYSGKRCGGGVLYFQRSAGV